jgi:hypothetical protein
MANMPSSGPPPHRVPVLTEVLHVPGGQPPTQTTSAHTEPPRTPGLAPLASAPAVAVSAPAAAPAAAVVLPTEDELVERVLHDLHRQIDLMFEQRLREKLSPALARIADMMVREVRAELGTTVRVMVERAVALEIARHRRE